MSAPAFPSIGFSRLSAIEPDIPEARYLPGEIYTSEEVARLEKSRLFMKSWLCVGRSEELANPGDFLTLRICGEPIVIAHDAEDSVVAFSASLVGKPAIAPTEYSAHKKCPGRN